MHNISPLCCYILFFLDCHSDHAVHDTVGEMQMSILHMHEEVLHSKVSIKDKSVHNWPYYSISNVLHQTVKTLFTMSYLFSLYLEPLCFRNSRVSSVKVKPSHTVELSVGACTALHRSATGWMAEQLKAPQSIRTYKALFVSDVVCPIKSKQWHSMACNCIHCWPL